VEQDENVRRSQKMRGISKVLLVYWSVVVFALLGALAASVVVMYGSR
jgi:hypothetical protein